MSDPSFGGAYASNQTQQLQAYNYITDRYNELLGQSQNQQLMADMTNSNLAYQQARYQSMTSNLPTSVDGLACRKKKKLSSDDEAVAWLRRRVAEVSWSDHG